MELGWEVTVLKSKEFGWWSNYLLGKTYKVSFPCCGMLENSGFEASFECKDLAYDSSGLLVLLMIINKTNKKLANLLCCNLGSCNLMMKMIIWWFIPFVILHCGYRLFSPSLSQFQSLCWCVLISKETGVWDKALEPLCKTSVLKFFFFSFFTGILSNFCWNFYPYYS